MLRFPIYSLPPYMYTAPPSSTPPAEGTFVTVNEPILAHHNPPKFKVYIRAHTCYTFCGVDNCIITCPSYRVFSLSLKVSVLHPVIPPFSPISGNHRSFYCIHNFAFSIMLYSQNHRVCRFFRLVPFN